MVMVISFERIISFTAALLTLLGLWLGAKQKIAVWPLNIFVSFLNMIVFYKREIYSSFFQSIVDVIYPLYGWYRWKYGSAQGTPLLIITKTGKKQWIFLGIGGVLYMILMALFLKIIGAPKLFLDLCRGALIVIGMWLTANKKLETYLVWVALNVVSILLFIQKQMPSYIGKHSILLIAAFKSYTLWRSQYDKQTEKSLSS